MAESVGAQEGLPPGVLPALVNQESGGDVNAKSPAGAEGLTQLMPYTAQGLGVTNTMDPLQNLTAGARYLKQQLDKFGSLPLALAAYNAGPGTVAKYGGIPPYTETQAYVRDIMAAMGQGGGAAAFSAATTPSPDTEGTPALTTPQQMIGAGAGLDPSLLGGGDEATMAANEANQPILAPPSLSGPTALGGGNPTAPDNAAPVVQAAKSFLGVPYKWGGNNPKTGLDCSSFVQQAFAKVGVNLPRTTYEQVKMGQPVALDQLQPGDAVFTEPGRAGPNHVGIYVGHGTIQQSPHTGDVNGYIPLKSFLGDGFVAARRYAVPTRGGKR
jgi:cell wall-associated NlpC family hydrolase